MRLLLLCLFSYSLYAQDVANTMLQYYNATHYKKACNYGIRKFNTFTNNEDLIALYAFSCLKADYIDRLAIPIALLKKSKDARSNAAYLATIFMQKKLLYHSLVDHYELKNIRLPSSDFLLSKVFDLYLNNSDFKHSHYTFIDPIDSKKNYTLYLQKRNGINKIVIESYYDKIMTEKHLYR